MYMRTLINQNILFTFEDAKDTSLQPSVPYYLDTVHYSSAKINPILDCTYTPFNIWAINANGLPLFKN
jgi:hypothetical protein